MQTGLPQTVLDYPTRLPLRRRVVLHRPVLLVRDLEDSVMLEGLGANDVQQGLDGNHLRIGRRLKSMPEDRLPGAERRVTVTRSGQQINDRFQSARYLNRLPMTRCGSNRRWAQVVGTAVAPGHRKIALAVHRLMPSSVGEVSGNGAPAGRTRPPAARHSLPRSRPTTCRFIR